MVDNIQRLERKFKDLLPAATKRRVKSQMAVVADKIVGSAENLVPQDQGDLLASIGWVWGNEDLPDGAVAIGGVESGDPDMIITVFAGSTATVVYNSRGVPFQNARLQEFGTGSMPANPYFFPAYRLNKRAGKSRMTRAVKAAAKEIS